MVWREAPGPGCPLGPSRLPHLTEEPRAGFLGIHHFHPLWSRHFIIWDHSVKQYDTAHFYLFRFTKSPFSPRRSNKKLGAARRPPASTASPARQRERREGLRKAGGWCAPLAARGNAAYRGRAPRWRVLGCGPGETRLSQSRARRRPPF